MLHVSELSRLDRARVYPAETNRQIEKAWRVIRFASNDPSSCGEVCTCISETEEFVRLTEALWDYFREAEGIF